MMNHSGITVVQRMLVTMRAIRHVNYASLTYAAKLFSAGVWTCSVARMPWVSVEPCSPAAALSVRSFKSKHRLLPVWKLMSHFSVQRMQNVYVKLQLPN